MPKTQKAKQGHTPGIWAVGENDEGHVVVISDDTQEEISEVFGGDCVEANARLIAAAPELLEACKEVLELETKRLSARAKEDLRAVIRRAEGGE